MVYWLVSGEVCGDTYLGGPDTYLGVSTHTPVCQAEMLIRLFLEKIKPGISLRKVKAGLAVFFKELHPDLRGAELEVGWG